MQNVIDTKGIQMTQNLTELMLSMDNEEKHNIKNRINFHIGDLTLDYYDNKTKVTQTKSQYHSLITQFYKPYEGNTYQQNVLLSMDKAYNMIKQYKETK